jgi:hypothetical protein
LSGVASIAVFAVESTMISPFIVPLNRARENPSFGSLPLADISTSPLITEFHVTVTCTLGYEEYLHTSNAKLFNPLFAIIVEPLIITFQLLFESVYLPAQGKLLQSNITLSNVKLL